ncbi:TMEM43 family protein [Oribacterium sp. FC2011]|uniref:TMEM43 family protein n=1 Tax=Oribacterium sp. FC2011 TaxID=1408311 RepID=UPI0004E23D8A|nr:TMEM43 family protein [Oribacterium sp. FC2011]
MIKKLIGVVLILVGGFFTFAATKAVFANPATVNQLEEAPFITDGKVDPANEGKDIILLVSTDLIDNAEDYELGLRFKYPVIHREVEELKYDGVDQIKWERLYSFNNEEALTDEVFFGNINGLEYEVDSSLLISLGGNSKQLQRADYNNEDLQALFDEIQGLRAEEYNDILYITDTDSRYFKNCDEKKASDLLWNDYTEQVGAIRISYRGTVVDNIDSIALIGKQAGNRLEKSDTIDSISFFENIHSKEELMKEHKKTSVFGIGFGLIVSIALLLSGVFLIVKS